MDDLPPPTPFSKGDLCVIIPGGPFSGRECTVLGPIMPIEPGCGHTHWVHPIEIQGREGETFAAEHHVLKKVPPPDTKLHSWDECPFQPEEVYDPI